jgi:glycosyltransferase involved in cell wall biosynthesis
MRIALCTVQVPFIRGGAESHCDNLYRELINSGVEVEYIKIPFKWYPPQEIINHALLWRLIDLSESNGNKIDGVIATKFPSWVVKHKNKIVWLLHQHRVAYEQAHTSFDDLEQYGALGEIVRKRIRDIDNKFLTESRKIYTNSRTVSERLIKYNNIKGEPLYHPPPLMGRYSCKSYENYIFYPSRLDLTKRQNLIIRSMTHIKDDIKLKIAGNGPELDRYKHLARDLGVEDRVEFLGRVSDEQLLELYANALCVTYVPFDEDLGYVTMEGLLSRKPVITCTDSGGPLEFVEDEVNGYVVEPVPEKIAEKINILEEHGISKRMGASGYKKMSDMNLSWDHVVKKLLEPLK